MILRAPKFWETDGTLSHILSPIGKVMAAITAQRIGRPGWRAPVPVICVGNATVGGSGKTTVALELGARLLGRGLDPHFLIRGYRGSARGTRRVRAGDDAALVGDEALLLAALAPTWTGADRTASARAALADGAKVLVMDDGLQNPELGKDLSLLVIDGAYGFGNGRLLPSGPLREPVRAAAGRCRAAVLIGEARSDVLTALPAWLPVLRARLVPDPSMRALAGETVFAFAGIGRPAKFFNSLAQAGAVLAGTRSFPDHHRFGEHELRRLLADADRLRAALVTTPKDHARLPAALASSIRSAGVHLVFDSDACFERLVVDAGIGGTAFT